MRQNPFFSIFLIGMLAAGPVVAEAEINLQRFLTQVQHFHPAFKQAQLKTDQQGYLKNAALGINDTQFHFSPGQSNQQPLAFNDFSPNAIDTYQLNTGIEKAFWRTGGRFSTTLSSISGDIGFGTSSVAYHLHELNISYRHPLLRNRSGSLDQSPYFRQSLIEETETIQEDERRQQVFLAYSEAFVDWVFYREQKLILRSRMVLGEKQLAQAKKQYAKNLIERVDVLRFEDAVQLVKQELMLATAQESAIKNRLAIESGFPALLDMMPDFDLYNVKAPTNPEIVPLETLNPMRIQTLLREASDIAYQEKKEALKADLSLILSATKRGQAVGQSFESSTNLDREDTFVGFEYRRSLKKTAAKAELDFAKAAYDMQALAFDETALSLKAQLHELFILLEEYQNMIRVNKALLSAAKEKTAEETRLYQQGRNPLSVVITAQDSEQRSRIAYAKNAADYQKLYYRYMALTDEMPTSYLLSHD